MELIIYIVAALVVVSAVFFLLIWATTFHPDEIQSEPVVGRPHAPLIEPDQTLKIMTWNVQYMAGKNYVFWYDLPDWSGPDERPSSADLTETLTAVAQIIEDEDPDVILLQEIDDGSKRTDHVDQLRDLLTLLPETYCCHASAFYWKAAFVPHRRIMGAVGMKLSTVSKYRISEARRHRLPALPLDPVTRQFHLKRSILETRLPLTDGRSLVMLNTHLESFDREASVRQRQMYRIKSLLSRLNREQFPWVIGGDFNLLPSTAAYDRLTTPEKKGYPPETEISTFYRLYQGVPGLDQVDGREYKKWYTHFPNKSDITAPDRTIDYIFISANIQLGRHYVRQQDTIKIADHFPVIAEINIP
jgi:endonuclease/exonuclease/phosphatase family metal-dependent hydrolase